MAILSELAKKLAGKNRSGTMEEALINENLGKKRLRRAGVGAGVAAGAGGVGLFGDTVKERIGELASSKQRKKTMDAETQDVKRPYMPPKEKKAAPRKTQSASINPPPSSVREQYPDAEKSPVNDSGHVAYESSQDDIHPESSSVEYKTRPFSDLPIDEAATSLNRMGKYAKGGSIGRGMGAATRGGGCVMKRGNR